MSLPMPKADYERYFGKNATHPVIFPNEAEYTGDGTGPVCKANHKPIQQIVTGRANLPLSHCLLSANRNISQHE